MKLVTTPKSLAVAVLALALVALTAAGPASAGSRCAPRAGATPNSCYPKHITGTFSGSNSDYVWSGTVSLTRHREQTIFLYSGSATVSWEHRDVNIGAGCTLSPANGAFTQRVELQVNRVPDRRRGWSYAAGGSGQGDTGPEYSDCDGDRLSNGHGVIDNVFDAGGFTKNLRRFSGQNRESSEYHRAWALKARS
jgi:hypothetical protein